jgi:hypothetical protein
MNLSPLPIQKFFDSNGAPLVSGRLFTYVVSTSTKLSTYKDQAGTLNTNPIVLDYRGEANVWLDQTLTYKFVLAPPGADDPPTNPIWTVDNISAAVTYASLTQQIVGQILYPKSAAETSAGVTIVNYFYPYLCVNRYGTNSVPGTTSMRAAWQAAIDVAKITGGEITWDASMGAHLIDNRLDCTNPVGSTNKGYSFRGTGNIGTFTLPPNPLAPDVIFSLTGANRNCFDCTGTLGVFFENMSITTSTNEPEILFLMARNTDARSMYCRWTNVMVLGSFSKAIVYNYGMEEEVYEGCQFFNRSAIANAKAMCFTGRNIKGVASTFTTIATGQQSTISHTILGGSIQMFSNQADADCVEIEGGARTGRVYGTWMDCKNASAKGRSLFYFNGTNSESDGWLFSGVVGESSAFQADYGIRFGNEAARTYSKISIRDCTFPNSTNSVSAGALIILSECVLDSIGNQSVGGGVNIAGTLQKSYTGTIDGGLTAATFTSNNEFRRQGEANIQLSDGSAAANSKSVRVRCVGGQFVLSAVNDAGAVYANMITATFNGAAITAMSWGAAGTATVFAGTHGFNGTAAIAKPTVSGAKAGNAALASLCTALASYGLITDSTT